MNEYGIIPARAGFTRTPWRERPPFSDHPRSRGVYTWAAAPSCPTYGSSPLARGLRSAHRGVALPDRIIPARAGFTAPPSSAEPPIADHPRSRGVYPWQVAYVLAPIGSSPLARGLRRSLVCTFRGWGIIPARAGFTQRLEELGRALGDHPRSRGVYITGMEPPDVEDGSSPLARGLRKAGQSVSDARRIIPARAGFTPPTARRLRACADHPRSRGVYGARA